MTGKAATSQSRFVQVASNRSRANWPNERKRRHDHHQAESPLSTRSLHSERTARRRGNPVGPCRTSAPRVPTNGTCDPVRSAYPRRHRNRPSRIGPVRSRDTGAIDTDYELALSCSRYPRTDSVFVKHRERSGHDHGKATKAACCSVGLADAATDVATPSSDVTAIPAGMVMERFSAIGQFI